MINKYASHFMYCVSINFLFRALMKIYNLSITFSPTHISLMTTIIFGWGIFYDNRLEEDEKRNMSQVYDASMIHFSLYFLNEIKN